MGIESPCFNNGDVEFNLACSELIHAIYACIVAVIAMPKYTMLSLQNNQITPYLVAIVDHPHIGLATASFEDLVTLDRRTLQQIL